MFDVKLMRRLDSQVGNLACSLLAVAKRMGLPRRRDVDAPVRQVAVAKFFGLGHRGGEADGCELWRQRKEPR